VRVPHLFHVRDERGRRKESAKGLARLLHLATHRVEREPARRVAGWAGPWPLSERWWDPAAARRRARFQLATDDGRAWLAVVQDGRWQIEAGYW